MTDNRLSISLLLLAAITSSGNCDQPWTDHGQTANDSPVIIEAAPTMVEGSDATLSTAYESSVSLGSVAGTTTLLYMVFDGFTNLPGIGMVANEDIVSFDLQTGVWSMIFDGSDLGLNFMAIDALAVDADGNFLLSFTAAGNIPDLEGAPGGGILADDSDIVVFHPTTLGTDTAGSFEFLFDGSDIGLTTEAEDIDAIALGPDGTLFISTLGSFNAGGSAGDGKDLFRFAGTTIGSLTTGSLIMYFDGSDVQLTNASEELDAAAFLPFGWLLLSTSGSFNVAGIPGGDSDVLAFSPTTLGATTIGSFTIFLTDVEIGIPAVRDIVALDVVTIETP